ncbi:biotin/lipoyl-binding protein [Paraburkholderia sp. SIMBA_030]|uniref:biotin/lipoyl-binding protein n=1 Tax=Paraburkholderia sp. SIMBA_030 TaxID=3085773 RepID=UPI00397D8C5D
MSHAPDRPRSRWPSILITLAAAVLLGFALSRLDNAPQTDDASVYADTIDVAPEVSGRIVDLAVRDKQAVGQGQVLFSLDSRSYRDAHLRSATGQPWPLC